MTNEKVLILLHADGFVEAYASREIEFLVRCVPFTESPTGEAMAEELVELTLPDRFRRLYSADRLRATGNVRKILPSEIAESMYLLRSSREFDALAQKYAPGSELTKWTA